MKKKKFKTKKKIDINYLLISVAILALLSLSLLIAYSMIPSASSKQEERINMHITVGNYAGFNVDTDALYFGTVVPGARSERTIRVENTGSKKITAVLRVSGILEQWTVLSKNNFKIAPGMAENVSVKVTAPDDAKLGNYSSTLIIIFK